MHVFKATNFLNYQLFNIKRLLKVSIAIIALTVGGLVYVIFRSENLLMFDWFNDLGLGDVVMKLREDYGHMNLWEWARYNMPAGLWLFSYMFIIDSIWEGNNSVVFEYYISVLPVVAIVSEVLQFFKILPGTFDVLDVFSYVFAVLLYLIIKKSRK